MKAEEKTRQRGVVLMTANDQTEYKVFSSFIKEENQFEISVDSKEENNIYSEKCNVEDKTDTMYKVAKRFRGKGYGIASAYGSIEVKKSQKTEIKTFKDLEFKKHPNFEGLHATMTFPNSYGVSVIRFKTITSGYGSYTSNENEWEVAVMHNDRLCYDTPITDDVIGHCSDDEVSEIMMRVQELDQ